MTQEKPQQPAKLGELVAGVHFLASHLRRVLRTRNTIVDWTAVERMADGFMDHLDKLDAACAKLEQPCKGVKLPDAETLGAYRETARRVVALVAEHSDSKTIADHVA